MKYVNGDFNKFDGLFDDIVGVVTGGKDLKTLVSGAVYDEVMKQVSKNADIVKSFATKATSAANAVASQVQKISLVTDQNSANAVLAEAKKQESIAKTEASNAAKNFSATQASMKLLLNIKGLPQSVIDSANAILTSARKSLDTANAASQRATQALSSVQAGFNAKYGSFLTNIPGFSKLSTNTIMLIGGGILAVSILGFITYRIIKKKGE